MEFTFVAPVGLKFSFRCTSDLLALTENLDISLLHWLSQLHYHSACSSFDIRWEKNESVIRVLAAPPSVRCVVLLLVCARRQ